MQMTTKKQRRPLTSEEKEDAARLKRIWETYKAHNPEATQEWLAEQCGWTQGAVQQYLQGRIPLNAIAAMKFAEALNVPLNQVNPRFSALFSRVVPGHYINPETGEINDQISPRLRLEQTIESYQTSSAVVQEQDAQHKNTVWLSKVSASASTPIKLVTCEYMPYPEKWFTERKLNQERCIVLSMKGESMWPTINDEDDLIINRADCALTHEEIYAFLTSDSIRIRRVLRPMGSSAIKLRADNPAKEFYGGDETMGDNTQVIGKVVYRGGTL